jgi:recombinational DNA repair protein RecR
LGKRSSFSSKDPQKSKGPATIEDELSKYIETDVRVKHFSNIGPESASRICSLIFTKKTETAKTIIAKLREAHGQES